MKKLLVVSLITVLGISQVRAQEQVKSQESKFGVTAGYTGLTVTVNAPANGVNNSSSLDISGFYVGLFGEFSTSEVFKIQTELQYATHTKDGNSESEIIIPIIGKFYVSNEFNLQVGPQIDIITSETTDNVNSLGIGIAAGLGFDISENVFINSRYTFGLSNRLKDTTINGISSLSVKYNFFNIGLGYRF